MNLAITPEDLKAVAAKGYDDPHFFLKFFLEEWFSLPMPWVHRGLLAILTRRCAFLQNFDEDYTEVHLQKIIKNFTWKEDPSNPESPEHSIFSIGVNGALEMTLSRHTLVMMPRGISKTTLANAVTIWYICYQERRFPVYVSEAQTHASRQLTNVTTQLTTNARLLAVFGNPKPEQRSGLTWSESEGFVQTTTGISIASKGRGSQIRGLNVNGRRPDFMLWDDLEDKEAVKTEDQREKTKEWAFGDALPALPKLDPTASIVAMGTLLASNALLTVMESDPEWTTVKFGALDKEGAPIWEAWMSLERIEAEKESYAAKGLLHIFYLEYFNTVRDPEKAKFKPSFIIIEPVSIDRPEFTHVPYRAMCIDPAISKRKRACPSVISVVGMRPNGIIQILDEWGKVGATPREQIDMYFELHFKWLPQKHGVETVAYQAALAHFLREEMFRQGKLHGPEAYFEIDEVAGHDSKKEERIEGILQPRYASGYVRQQRPFPKKTAQLLDWPLGGFDYPDAEAMAISLLDDYAALAGGDTMNNDHMPPLEDVYSGDWRTH